MGRSDIGGTTVEAWVPERSRLTEALTAQGSSMRAPLAELLETITDAFVAIDDEWRYVYVNERAAQILGRPARWLVGRSLWNAFPELVGSRTHLAYHEAFAQQQTREFEDTSDGRWLTHRVFPSSRGLTVFFQDISDRRRSEQAAVSGAAVGDTVRAANLAAAAAGDPRDGVTDVLSVLTSGLALDTAVIHGTNRDWGDPNAAFAHAPGELTLTLRAGHRSYGTLEIRRAAAFDELEEASVRAVAALLALLLSTQPTQDRVIELNADNDRAAQRQGSAPGLG